MDGLIWAGRWQGIISARAVAGLSEALGTFSLI